MAAHLPVRLSQSPSNIIKYRLAKIGLVPYVELLPRKFGVEKARELGIEMGPLPIRTVVQGPTPESDLAHESLVGFLTSKGYLLSAEDVLRSDVPLRF